VQSRLMRLRAWIKGMVSPARSAGTVSNTWLNGSSTVFGWAVDQNLVPSNPFADVRIVVPKQFIMRARALAKF
jgi:hypothetical protein